MSSWEFVKRHRNKIAAVATAIGGAYAVKKVLDHQGVNPREWFGGQKSKEVDDETLSMSRKHFIFDSHQQSCDKQVQETVEELLKLLNARFNTEQLVRRLQTEENIQMKEKIELWEQMKVKTFARLLSLAYMHSIVLLALKTQKSVLCRETIRNFEKKDERAGGLFAYVSSLFSEPANAPNSRLFAESKAQQVFLNCINYLTTHGMNLLFDRVETAATEVLAETSLAKEFDGSSLKALLEKLKFRVECAAGESNFADLVVPVVEGESLFATGDFNAVHLEELLSKLSAQLQSPRARAVLSLCTQRYVNEIVDLVENKSAKPTALAKLLPALNAAHSEISSTSFNSVLQQNIASPELYQFSQMVFTA
ncbi:Peroxisomal assembly protein PEX3 [Aphelenchoides fujianensis]|nr:Peroxisomal assembly protein PEX3 [Aphelenchoides fujianensis]